MAEKTLKISLLYLSLHNLLKRKYGINKTISRKQLYCILGKHYLVDKRLRPVIIKEMESFNLINKIDRENIKILDCTFDPEKDANKFYKAFGLN